MGAFEFHSFANEFLKKHTAFKDMAQGRMAIDIERFIKTEAGTPVKTGNMKSMVRHFKSSSDNWRVEANAVYSAYQERGQRKDGSHVVRHYTTAGTSAGWFDRSIKKIASNKDAYIKEARQAVFGL